MISFEGVSKTYRGRGLELTVLRDASFEIPCGDSLAILGANGAGKSTLLRLISGVEHPTEGCITRGMTVSWPIGHGSCFQSSLTGADNARFIARVYRRDAQEVLEFVEGFAQLGRHFRQPVNTYSSGMTARLAFAISLAVEFDCQLVDEVISAGDERFQQRCHDALAARRASGTLVMVSHSPSILRGYCRRGAVLRGGVLTFYESLEAAIEDHQAAQRLAG